MAETSAATGVVQTAQFAVPLPDGWSDATTVTLVGPRRDGYVPNVVVTRHLLCAGMGLGGFADGQGNLIREHVGEYAVLSTEHATMGGERAIVRTVRWRLGEETPVVQVQGFCLRDGYGYAFVATAPEALFAEAEPGFRAALDGFVFTD